MIDYVIEFFIFGLPIIYLVLAVVFWVLFFCFLFIWKKKSAAITCLVLAIVFSVVPIIMIGAFVALMALLMVGLGHM
ncbi:MAG: hypothetical protein E7266_04755 [Lachnospiraceae bacterium]|nr:hypothetical protein [Lachnospiraceae bacterium]